jgi:hypothetical protein
VTLSESPDGGTTAEVFLPPRLISPDTTPGSWPRQAGETLRTRAGEGADAWVSVAELPFSALRFAAGPEPPLEPETDPPEAVPLELGVPVLGAPVPSPAIEAPAGVTLPEPAGAEPGGVLPIFESVEAGHFRTFGRGLLRVDEPQATAGESAEIMRSRLTSFQRGSRRARTAAQLNRGAKQPGQDG